MIDLGWITRKVGRSTKDRGVIGKSFVSRISHCVSTARYAGPLAAGSVVSTAAHAGIIAAGQVILTAADAGGQGAGRAIICPSMLVLMRVPS